MVKKYHPTAILRREVAPPTPLRYVERSTIRNLLQIRLLSIVTIVVANPSASAFQDEAAQGLRWQAEHIKKQERTKPREHYLPIPIFGVGQGSLVPRATGTLRPKHLPSITLFDASAHSLSHGRVTNGTAELPNGIKQKVSIRFIQRWKVERVLGQKVSYPGVTAQIFVTCLVYRDHHSPKQWFDICTRQRESCSPETIDGGPSRVESALPNCDEGRGCGDPKHFGGRRAAPGGRCRRQRSQRGRGRRRGYGRGAS